MEAKLQAWCWGSLLAACLAACAQTKPVKESPVYLTLPQVNEPELATDKQPPPPRPIVVTVRPDSPPKPTDIAQRSTAKAKSTAAKMEDGAGGAGSEKCDLPNNTPDPPKKAHPGPVTSGLGNPGRQGSKDAPIVSPNWRSLRTKSAKYSTTIWTVPANFEAYNEARQSGKATLLIFSGPDDICSFCKIFHETAEPELSPRLNARFDGHALRDDSYGRSPLAAMLKVTRVPYFVVMAKGSVRRVVNDIESERLADSLIAAADALEY